MKALTNNTLIAISKHTNKVLKMATYMAQSEQGMLLDNIYMIDDNTSQKDALELFQKDFDKTVDLIEKSHQLMSTVRGDHIVEQLDNNIKDLRTIFLDKYDEKTFSIKLPSITISLKSRIDKDTIRDHLSRDLLDISYKDFKDFLKNCEKIYKLDENLLETEEDAVEYLASLAYREKYDEIVKKIKSIAGEFSEYRNNLGLEKRNIIDNEITFTRSMIDSIMKNSTYITKTNVEQLASPHKKNMPDIQRLFNFIKTNNYISSIELDPDTNIKAVIDILIKTEDLKLNIPEQFCLKCRKLGNYNANGLYLQRQHIAAVDITNPSALIHELTHTADMSNPELYNHQLREEIVAKSKKRIDVNDLVVKNRLSYYLNSDEIIARLGEIAYILNKNNYDGTLKMSEFIEKVRLNEKDYNSEFLNIAKPIDEYLRFSNVYFNFEQMSPKDLIEIKEYFRSYFGVNNDDIKPIYSKAIEYEQKVTKKAKKRINEFKDSPFVKLDPLSVRKALEYNLEKNIIPFDDLFAAIAENIHMVSRRKKGISPEDFRKQAETFTIIYDWAAETNNKDIQVSLLKNMFMFAKTPQAYSYSPIQYLFVLSKTEEQLEKFKSIFETFNNCRYLNDSGMMEFRRTHGKGLHKIMDNLTFEDIYTRIDKTDVLTYAIPLAETFRNIYNSVPNKNNKLEDHYIDVLKDLKAVGFNDLIDYAYKDKKSSSLNSMILNDEQISFLDNNKKSISIMTRILSDDRVSISSHYIKYSLDRNYLPILDRYKPLYDQLNAIDANDKSLLGINKVTDDNYRERRKLILDNYIKDLQEKQALEAKNVSDEIKPVNHSVINKLNQKIEEDKMSVIDEKPSENKPIVSSQKNQMKLF